MKNVNKDLAQLKLYSVEELMSAYSMINHVRDRAIELELDLDEAFEDLKNELKSRPVADLVEWMTNEKRL